MGAPVDRCALPGTVTCVHTYLDVDGVLLPPPPRTSSPWKDWATYPFSVTASQAMGAELGPVVDTITWASTWRDLANDYISPVFGWGQRPVLERKRELVWWKLEAIGRAHPLGVPLVWVDDEINERDVNNDGWIRSYISKITDTYLLICPETNVGLTPEHIDEIVTFANTHR